MYTGSGGGGAGAPGDPAFSNWSDLAAIAMHATRAWVETLSPAHHLGRAIRA